MGNNLTKVLGKYFITFGTIPPTYVHDVWGLCLVLSSFVFEEERELVALKKEGSFKNYG